MISCWILLPARCFTTPTFGTVKNFTIARKMMSLKNLLRHRSMFNLDQERKLSCKMGYLVPILAMDVIPGDTIIISAEALIRLAPQIAPVMHKVNAFVEYFFVPNRIIWDDWEKFITGGETRASYSGTPPLEPYFMINDDFKDAPPMAVNPARSATEGSLFDYIAGVTGDTTGFTKKICALPFRAYNEIYYEWYRDENLVTDEVLAPIVGGTGSNDYGSGRDLISPCTLMRRMWNRDYFTTCLPWPQKGDDVMFPPLATPTQDPTSRYNVKADPLAGDPRFYKQGTAYGYPDAATFGYFTDNDGKFDNQPLNRFNTTAGTAEVKAHTGTTVAYTGTAAGVSANVPQTTLKMDSTNFTMPEKKFSVHIPGSDVSLDSAYIQQRDYNQNPIPFYSGGYDVTTASSTLTANFEDIAIYIPIKNRNESQKPLSNLQVHGLDAQQQVWAVDTNLSNYDNWIVGQTVTGQQKFYSIPSLKGTTNTLYGETQPWSVRLPRMNVSGAGAVPEQNVDVTVPSYSGSATPTGVNPAQSINVPGAGFTVPSQNVNIGSQNVGIPQLGIMHTDNPKTSTPLGYFPNGQLYVDVNADPITQGSMNQLRMAVQLQKWLERNARGGTRYVEFIKAHFGVRSSDARLQRPEFLGGGRCPLVFSEVLQTSASPASATKAPLATTGTPLATMGGHSFGAIRTRAITKTCEEHGWIIGILSIVPRTAYVQSLEKKFRPRTRMDYYMPEFAHLGEQAVRNDEVHCTFTSTDDVVFGYQPIYEHYRRAIDHVNGDFRSSLNYWHFARTFTSAPPLNADFLFAKPTTAPFAVSTGDTCWIQFLNKVRAIRPIPRRAEPGLMDHF